MSAFLRVRAENNGFAVEGDPCVSLGGGDLSAGVGTGYVRWHWTGNRLRLEVDRYGAYPAFYEVGTREISVATALPLLLQVDRRRSLDFDALSVFFRLGFFLDEDTPLREIRALPPGGVLEWSAAGLDIRTPERRRYRPLEISRRDAVAEFQRLFVDAVRRCETPQGSRTIVPLSGGRDSRHILLELCTQHRMPHCCVSARHFPPRPDEDCVIAQEVCNLLSLPLHVIPQSDSMFKAELNKNAATSFCADEHAWLLPLAGFLDQQEPDYIFDGLGGNVLSAGLFVTPSLAEAFRTAKAETVADALLRARPVAQGFGGRALKAVASWQLMEEVGRARAVERLARAVQPHLEAPNPIASFFFWNRTRREIALSPFALLGGRAVVFTPFLDHQLFDFLCDLPLSMVEDQSFHSDTIAWGYPHARALRYEDKGVPASDARRHYRRFAREAALWDIGRGSSPLVRPSARIRLVTSVWGAHAADIGAEVGRMYCYLSQLGRSTSWAVEKDTVR